MRDFLNWMRDDMSFCLSEDCDAEWCYRHCSNMANPTGIHTFSLFKGTSDCPRTRCTRDCDVTSCSLNKRAKHPCRDEELCDYDLYGTVYCERNEEIERIKENV